MPKKPRKISRLQNIDTREVSLVAAGANLKRFSLRKGLNTMDETIAAILKAKAENEDQLRTDLQKAGMEGDALEAAVAFARLRDGFADVVDNDGILKALGIEVGGKSKDDEPTLGDILKTEKGLAEVAKALGVSASDLADLAKGKSKDDGGDPLEKSLAGLDPAARAAITKSMAEGAAARKAAEEKAAELEKSIAAERNVRLTREAIEKAADFTDAGLKAEEFGPVLRDIEENLSEESADYLKKHLKRLGAEVHASELFKSRGGGATGAKEGVFAEATKRAQALMKAHPGTYDSLTEARVHLFKSDPELKRMYEEEQYGNRG